MELLKTTSATRPLQFTRSWLLITRSCQGICIPYILPCHMPRIDIDNCPLVTTSVAESACMCAGGVSGTLSLQWINHLIRGGNGCHWQGSSQHALCYRSMSSWYHQPTCVRFICLFVAGKTEERHFWSLILMWNMVWDFFLLHQVKYLFAFY